MGEERERGMGTWGPSNPRIALAMFAAVVCFALLATSREAEASRSAGESLAKAQFKAKLPYIIAHRGASLEFPESSAPAFKRAIEQGASFIETDIGATKDGYLICLHDTTLDAITDVANKTEFRDRLRTYEVEGHLVTGYFAVDFTLDEIKTLRLYQRLDFRDQSYNGMYEIPTFDEYLAIATNSVDRVVGVDPEIKNPVFINKHVKWENGKLFEDKFVETLIKHGYNSKYLSKEWMEKPVIIQTFAPFSILHIVNKTVAPKVFNIGPGNDIAQGTNMTYGQLVTDAFLDSIAPHLLGVSSDKARIAPVDQNRRLLPTSDLINRAHARGLQIHPATYRNEEMFIPRDFNSDLYLELDFAVRKLGVDAIIMDNPATLRSYLKAFEMGIADDLWG